MSVKCETCVGGVRNMCVGLWGMCWWSMNCVCKVECEILVWVEYKE